MMTNLMSFTDVKNCVECLTKVAADVIDMGNGVILITIYSTRIQIKDIKEIVKMVNGRRKYAIVSFPGKIGIEVNTTKHGIPFVSDKKFTEVISDVFQIPDMTNMSKMLSDDYLTL